MKILVTGASGFLGSHIAACLVGHGHCVSGLIRHPSQAADLARIGATAVHGDLANPSSFLSHVDDADAVIFAAQLMLQEEYDCISAILDRLEGSGKTLIFTSGTGVLSERTNGGWSENTFTETDSFVPSKYIGGRIEAEDLVRKATSQGVRGMVVRPPMIWGNGQAPIIKDMFRAVAATGTACYIGAGLNLYSNVHVDDLAEVYALALTKGTSGSLYHAVSGETNYRTLAQAIGAQLSVPARSIDLAEAVEIWGKFPAILLFSTCSRSRSPLTRAELGWLPGEDRLDILTEVSHPSMMAWGRSK